MKNILTYQLFESIVNRKKDDEIFNYNSIVEDAWRPKIKAAQEFQKINFDLENDDTTDEKKTIYIKKNLRKDQPVKYEFNCELCHAGGDWEEPVMYFRVEFTHEHLKHKTVDDKPEFVFDLEPKIGGLSRCYVLIPPNEAGNHLFKTEKGYTAYTDETLKKEGIKKLKLTDENHKKAWKWLEDLITKLVDERHEMLD